MSTFGIILDVLNGWVILPTILYFTLRYAKQSVVKDLSKVDDFLYFMGIILLVMGGVS